jgi:CDP-6-deoxy-D-xylo-4-hexulose-3-dehydrase
MILDSDIQKLIQGHTPKYIYNSKEFTPGKTPVYYSGPYWDEKEVAAAINAFLNGKWLVAGENVHKFEHAFSRRFNQKYSHMVNSGSSANLAMITALKYYFKWEDGDEIIVSPVGFPTTIAPLAQNNLKPVFIDIEFNSLNFDVFEIESKITPRTKAIFVSPVLGNPPDMGVLSMICFKHNLQLIGDNCDSLGSKWKNKLLTDYYVASSCSFYPAHHITTGEGGMVSSNNEEIIKLVRSVSWWGRDCYCVGSSNLLPCGTCGNRFDKWLENYDGVVDHKYVFTTMGYNLKPLDLQGAIGLIQLEKFEEIEGRRKNSFERISKLIDKYIPYAKVADKLLEADPSWFGVPIICDTRDQKEKLVQLFEANKIQTRNYFAGNILLHKGYEHLDNYENYPYANKALSHVFFIGAAPHYGEEVFEYIEQVLKNNFKG